MANEPNSRDDLRTLITLFQDLLAVELWRSGLSQAEIGKRLRLAKVTVNKMLRGVSRSVLVSSQTRNGNAN
jgi:hypothetical protein